MQAVAVLGLLANDIKHRINKLSTLRVVPLRPVVAGTGLTEDEVIRPKDLAKRTRSNGVHGTWLKVHEDGAGNEAASAGLVEIDIDALKLKIRVAVILSGVIDAVLVANHLPELGPDLVAALPSLDVQDFSHRCSGEIWRRFTEV